MKFARLEIIGNSGKFTQCPFTGDFNGNNFEIQNLMINRPGEDRVGLFARTSGANITSISLTGDVAVSGGVTTGALVGFQTSSILDDIEVYGNKKSIEGSIAFFVCSLILALVFFPFVGYQILVIPIILTMTEFGLVHGFDNLILPIIAGFLAKLLF